MPGISGYRRGHQPRCERCHHSASFHGKEQAGHCHALGCQCEEWVEPTLTVAEVADVLGRSEDYVRDHARSLGGRKRDKRWRFPLGDFERVRAEHTAEPAPRKPSPAKG